MFVLECFDQAGLIAGEGRRIAIAYLTPKELPSLGTTTTEEQVVIHFIIGGGSFSIENSWRSALQRHENGGVILSCKYMSPQPVRLPTEALRVVETTAYVLPLCIFACFNIRISRRSGE